MAPIITGGVSANEPASSIYLLNLFQFPKGVYGEGELEGGAYIFVLAVINYCTDEI